MNPPRYVRFPQPHYLEHIGRERVTKILLPFAQELVPHGIALPALASPDDLFFQMIASLTQRASSLSAGLLDAMSAIEVIDEVFPDERRPLVVTELRLRLRSAAEPIRLQATAGDGTPLDGSIELVANPTDSVPSAALLAELREQRELLAKMKAQFCSKEKEASAHAEGVRPVLDVNVAREAFALLQKMDAEGPQKPPLPLTVFRLYCVDGCSAERVARKCRCSKGTVINRLRFIEKVTSIKPEDFRAVSSHLQQMDDEYKASGAREIYRRGLAEGGD